MRIERLSLRNFGRHVALDIDFAPTLTVIRGPNEAGKTTLQQALEYGFFRPPTATAAEVIERRNWSAPTEASVVSITFTDDAGVAGELTKRFDRSRGTVELTVGAERLNDPAQVIRRMVELTGLPSEKFMRATASIHHHELIGLHHDEATLRDRLQRAISGAEAGTRDARRKLEERIARYRAAGPKNPGDVKVARDEVERLTAAVEAGERALARLEDDRRALADARQRREAADKQLVGLRTQLDELRHATDTAAAAATAADRYERYRRAVELRGLSSERPRTLAGPAIDRRISVLVATLAGLVVVGGLVVGGAALWLGLAGGAVLGVLAVVLARRTAPGPVVAHDSAAMALSALLGEQATLATAELERQRDAAAAEMERLRHALAGMGELAAEPARRLAALEREIGRLQRERDDMRDAEQRAAGRLSSNDVDAEQVAAVAEALAAARDRLAAVERRLRIYSRALEALSAAEEKTMKKVARYLEAEMAADIARISGGRYSQVHVDEASLAFTVQSAERGDWVGEAALSQGTRDQIFLCARLGIIRQATAPARPPLVLDDPFVTFDDDRARRAIELLRDFAAGNQVILLTTSDRYDALAAAVVELPAPAVATLAAPATAAA
jgi:uncharacterized protein YhaN